MKVKERIPLRLILDYYEKEDLQNVLANKDFVDLVFEETLRSITFAIKNKKKVAPIFEVSESDIFIIVKKENFKNTLTQVLKYYESIEYYERCSLISKLLKTLK